MTESAIPNTLEVLEKIRCNSQLNKHIHFNASKRNRSYHIWVGAPTVVITVLISFFLAVSGDRIDTTDYGYPETTQNATSSDKPPLTVTPYISQSSNSISYPIWMKWVGALLALVAAALSGIQTFFNFQKQYEGNHQIGNQYLSIARECERNIALYFDKLLELSELAAEVQHLTRKYSDTNSRAESFNVTDNDYELAKRFQDEKNEKELSLVQRKRKDHFQR